MTECLAKTASRLPAQGDIVPTKLCSHNSEAASINNFELGKLQGTSLCLTLATIQILSPTTKYLKVLDLIFSLSYAAKTQITT